MFIYWTGDYSKHERPLPSSKRSLAMTLSEYTEAVLLRQGRYTSKQPYHALQRRLARILRTVQVGNHKEIPWETAGYHWRDFGQWQPHGQRGISQALSVLWRNADSVHGHWDDIRRGKTSNRLDFPLWQLCIWERRWWNEPPLTWNEFRYSFQVVVLFKTMRFDLIIHTKSLDRIRHTVL